MFSTTIVEQVDEERVWRGMGSTGNFGVGATTMSEPREMFTVPEIENIQLKNPERGLTCTKDSKISSGV